VSARLFAVWKNRNCSIYLSRGVIDTNPRIFSCRHCSSLIRIVLAQHHIVLRLAHAALLPANLPAAANISPTRIREQFMCIPRALIVMLFSDPCLCKRIPSYGRPPLLRGLKVFQQPQISFLTRSQHPHIYISYCLCFFFAQRVAPYLYSPLYAEGMGSPFVRCILTP
jgi:hypothetical protein